MRIILKMLAAGSILIVLATCGLAKDSDFFIRGGDRVVFLGDSITEQKLYTTYIEAYTVTRFPKQKFTFRNSGWGGDTAWLRMRSFPDEKALFAAKGDAQQKLIEASVDECLNRDVVSLKPTVVTVNFGMNDHNYEAFREDIFKAYVCSQTEIAKVLKKAGARVVLMTPQPIEERRADPDKDPRNESINKFGKGLKVVASKKGALFVNQFDPYMKIMMREHAGKTNVCIGGGDAIHPGPVGHTIMASIILKEMKAPALVSSVEVRVLDGKGGKAFSETKCRLSNVKYDDTVLSFDREDECLPMPVDERAMDALKLATVLDDINRYELKVKGLKAERYDVTIDGEPAATVPAKDLAKGWNLAASAGPITKQARDVLALIFSKNLVGQTLWEMNLHPERAANKADVEKQLADLEARITATCQTKPHHFELKPAAAVAGK